MRVCSFHHTFCALLFLCTNDTHRNPLFSFFLLSWQMAFVNQAGLQFKPLDTDDAKTYTIQSCLNIFIVIRGFPVASSRLGCVCISWMWLLLYFICFLYILPPFYALLLCCCSAFCLSSCPPSSYTLWHANQVFFFISVHICLCVCVRARTGPGWLTDGLCNSRCCHNEVEQLAFPYPTLALPSGGQH